MYMQTKQPPEVFYKKKVVLKNCAIFTGKHRAEVCFNKVADLKACKFIERRLQHRFFPVNIVNFLRTPMYFEEYLEMTASVISNEDLVKYCK